MQNPTYKLEVFEGPLDLLLHLISKNKINIRDIPVSELLDQYMQHIEYMRRENLDIASDFLTMASRLVYIKTVSLLPKSDEAERLKEELVGELIEYQLCKQIAERLSQRANFDQFVKDESPIEFDRTYTLSHDVAVLYKAYLAAVGRGKKKQIPSTENFTQLVATKIVSVPGKTIGILKRLYRRGSTSFDAFFEEATSRSELVATFLALLELIRKKRIEIDDEDNITLSVGGGKDWKSKNSEEQ